MITKKNQTVYLFAFIFTVLAGSCRENLNSVDPPLEVNLSTRLSQISGKVANYTFDGKEGDAIALEVASRWISNYSKNNSKLSAHYFGKKKLMRMLSMKGSTGIRFYYSKEDDGFDKLIAVPADASGNDFSFSFQTRSMNSSVDLQYSGADSTLTGYESDSVALPRAQHVISNFSTNYAGGTIAHFFGAEIIHQILSQADCVGLRGYYALDDNGGRQLLLMGVTSKGENIIPKATTNGRVTGDEGVIADVSSPCPTLCSGQ
jgi:hypothetical protein